MLQKDGLESVADDRSDVPRCDAAIMACVRFFDIQSFADCGHVNLDGAFGDAKRAGDIPVGITLL